MKKFLFISAISLGLIITSTRVSSQSRQIIGRVIALDSIPIIKAQVLVKSTDSIYQSGENGMFKIICSNKDRIIVTANGFKSEKVKIKEDTEDLLINLELKTNPESLDIAYGFGHVKDRDRLFAASSLHDKNNDFSSYNNMLELIEGKFPGVDTYGGVIVIRGIGSPSGNNNPLIIVDGVRVEYEYFNRIAPRDVKSIDVIKDGTTAMYGADGGNGVIIVETKKKIE